MTIVWLALSGFLLGGAIAARQQGRNNSIVLLLGLAAFAALVLGVVTA